MNCPRCGSEDTLKANTRGVHACRTCKSGYVICATCSGTQAYATVTCTWCGNPWFEHKPNVEAQSVRNELESVREAWGETIASASHAWKNVEELQAQIEDAEAGLAKIANDPNAFARGIAEAYFEGKEQRAEERLGPVDYCPEGSCMGRRDHAGPHTSIDYRATYLRPYPDDANRCQDCGASVMSDDCKSPDGRNICAECAMTYIDTTPYEPPRRDSP